MDRQHRKSKVPQPPVHEALFDDNRDHLVGCQIALRQIEDRARGCGVTAVVGRPRAGKTWLLIEVARRLTAEDQFMVGYYELKGGEPSHLPFAAADLYARWLQNASFREQARQLWQHQRGALIPRVGELIGTVFDTLCSSALPLTSMLVRKVFAELSAKQSALATGGSSLQPLPYDQVLGLTQVVAKLTQKRIVLILDAWEQSPAQREEFQLLQTILRHQADWSPIHIILGVRSPDIIALDGQTLAEDFTRTLCEFDASAATYQLPEIDLSETSERTRTLQIVRRTLPFTAPIEDARIIELIGGYPGVLYHWFNRNTRSRMSNATDLAREAAAAHAVRYPDLHRLLDSLSGAEQELVAILALLPRLNAGRWQSLRASITGSLGIPVEQLSGRLIDTGVLEDSDFPSFGHDTRHQSARRWFITQRARLFRAQSERLILAIATDASADDTGAWIRWETLAASAATQIPNLSRQTLCLVHAACLVTQIESTIANVVFDTTYLALASEHPRTASLLASALRRRAVRRYERDNLDMAIADFTKIIDLPQTPPDLVPEALYNRGLCQRETGRIDVAIRDYTRCIDEVTDDVELLGMALNNRGMALTRWGDTDGALADFNTCIGLPGVMVRQLATALIRRATIVGNAGRPLEALNDLNRCIALPKVPQDRLTQALSEQERFRELASLTSDPAQAILGEQSLRGEC